VLETKGSLPTFLIVAALQASSQSPPGPRHVAPVESTLALHGGSHLDVRRGAQWPNVVSLEVDSPFVPWRLLLPVPIRR